MVRLRVKELLNERGMSMGKLSRLSDVSFSTVQRLCRDSSYSPTLNILERVARALNVPISELYVEQPDE